MFMSQNWVAFCFRSCHTTCRRHIMTHEQFDSSIVVERGGNHAFGEVLPQTKRGSH